MIAMAIRLVGNLSQDATLRYSADGSPAVTFEMVCPGAAESTSSPIARADRFTVRFYGPSAETHYPILNQGTPVYVVGTFQPRPFTRPEGSEGYALEVVAELVIPWADRQAADARTLAAWRDELDAALEGWAE
jgi:single-stranded DNA-binding protein